MPGSKPLIPASPATIASVAERADVSIATVSRVVNGIANKASPATVERVRQAIAELDYRPSSAGKSLRQKQSRLVALLAANLANPTMAAIAASAEAALREAGLVMVLCDTHDRPELQDEYLREMRAQQARAIVLLGVVDSPRLAAFRKGPVPLVFVNRQDPVSQDSRFVGICNATAGREVALHCLGRGLIRPAVLHAPLTSSATRDRVEAIAATFQQQGHPIPPERRLSPVAADHLGIGYTGAQTLRAEKAEFDSLICGGDLIAFGAHRALLEAGGDSGMPPIFGFDDSPMNDWIAPWLSSVRIPYDAFGPAIVGAIQNTQARHKTILKHTLTIRR